MSYRIEFDSKAIEGNRRFERDASEGSIADP